MGNVDSYLTALKLNFNAWLTQMLSRIISYLAPNASITPRNTAGLHTDIAITVNAVVGQRHVVHGIQWSYSGTPSGRITIATGSKTLLDLDIVAAGPGGFANSYVGDYNKNLVVTLYDGGGGVNGKLCCQTTSDNS